MQNSLIGAQVGFWRGSPGAPSGTLYVAECDIYSTLQPRRRGSVYAYMTSEQYIRTVKKKTLHLRGDEEENDS